MWPRETGVFPALDPAITEIPPRSKLFSLRPAGLGTDRVESLSSYLTRLARAHSVGPRRLIREVFMKAAADPGPLRFVARYTDALGTLDGLGRHALTFAALTAEVTSVPAVRFLTLLPLAGVLPRNGAGLLARHPRWCPECLADMIRAGEDVIRPLAWSLDLYRTCHRHLCPLAATCGHCGKAQPFVPVYPDLAHCAHCGKTLAHSPPVVPAPADADRWVAEALADLVARLPELDGVASRERFIAFLLGGIAERTGGNRAGFCRQLGLQSWVVKNWLTRGERPSLPQMLAIGYGLGVLPARMFLPHGDRPVATARPLPAKLRDRAGRPRLGLRDREWLARLLADIVGDPEDVRSMAAVARTVGLSRSCLKYWFPDECAIVSRKHAQAVAGAAAERSRIDCERVAEVVVGMARDGRYPSQRKVNEALRQTGLSLIRSDLKAAYREAIEKARSLQPQGGVC